MNIQEERTYILSESNTAQKSIIDLLEIMHSKTITELNVIDELSGDIDFSILSSLGFNNIKTIHLGKGKITNIIHIPNSVSTFNCSSNMLISLKLPSSITELNCSKNYIHDLDLNGIHHLIKLNCSDNELDKLENIPQSIREIYCDNNNITSLDLNELTSLKILHCSHNKLMIIQNLPVQLEDFKMDNNPMAIIEHIPVENRKTKDDSEIKIDYIEAINEYFKLKQKYEMKVFEMKKTAFHSVTSRKMGKLKAASIKPPCVNCRRNVGTLFYKKDNVYIAVCGDKTSPCNLNIKLYNGYFTNVVGILREIRELVDDAKDSIILQKLKTLFNYLSDAQSAHLFKKELQNYTEISEHYTKSYKTYEQLYNNMHKKELIIRKNEEIYELLENVKLLLAEYNKTDNIEILKTAVQMQKDDLIPKLEFLRRLKYEIMEMYNKNDMLYLVQSNIPLVKIASPLDDDPSHVIKFTK